MGNLAFVWYNRYTAKAEIPDPRFISFKAMWASHTQNYLPTEVQPATLEQITRENYSQFMTDRSIFEYMESLSDNGETNIFTLKDPQNYTLVGAIDSSIARYLSFQVIKCSEATSQTECADFGENNEKLKDYMKQYSFGLINLLNFIDYGGEIEPFEGPVKHIETWVRAKQIEVLDQNKFNAY